MVCGNQLGWAWGGEVDGDANYGIMKTELEVEML